MKIQLGLMTALMVLGLSSIAHAVGAAGCGPGSVLMRKNSWLSQTFALTTNNYFSIFLGSSVVSGTSNCKGIKGFVNNEREQRQFEYVVGNYKDISVQAARGHGESLVGLSMLMGCGEESEGALQKTLKSNYGQFFPESNADPVQLYKELKQVIKSDELLAQSCQMS